MKEYIVSLNHVVCYIELEESFYERAILNVEYKNKIFK